MKVLLAITKSNFGGAQRYVFDVAKGARDAGHEVSVLCGGEGMLAEKLKGEKIRVIAIRELGRDISIGQDIKVFLRILRLLKQERPDVFHVNSSKMGGLGALAGRLARVPRIIFTAHGWAFNESRPWWQRMVIMKLAWWTIALSHLTVCVSDKMRRDVWFFPFIQSKLAVIHNGTESFSLLPRKENIFTSGTLSELHYTKGLDILIRAFAEVLRGKPARIVIMGEGEERQELKELAVALDVQHQVNFAGFVPNAREHLGQFDIFTLTSRTEGLPYTLLEAGVASLPVVASRVGGIPEVITNNETGLLVTKENVSELSQALLKLFNDKELRMKLGANLHTKVENEFGLKQMLTATLASYSTEPQETATR